MLGILLPELKNYHRFDDNFLPDVGSSDDLWVHIRYCSKKQNKKQKQNKTKKRNDFDFLQLHVREIVGFVYQHFDHIGTIKSE